MAGSDNPVAAATADTSSSRTSSDRRRSSNGALFSGLMDQKRNSVDANHAARKASFAEQKPATGFLGSMWNSFTKGSEHGAGK